MSRDTKILITVIVLALVGAGILSLYLYFSSREQMSSSTEMPTPVVGTSSTPTVSAGTPSTDKTVSIGTEKVTRGIYQKIESGNIFYTLSAETEKFKKLKADQMILACTTQGDFETSQSLDYKAIKRLNTLTHEDLAITLKEGVSVVMLSDMIGGELLVHTVATSEDICK